MLCKCGCGRDTGFYTKTSKINGGIKGKPKMFIQGHNTRVPEFSGSNFRKGFIKSKETIRKLSATQKGKPNYALRGKKLSLEHRLKLSNARKGKPQPNKCGENNWNWKGGISPVCQRVRACLKYRIWRSDCFTRDSFTCMICCIRGGNLQVDHYPKEFSVIFEEYNIKSFDEAMNCEEL